VACPKNGGRHLPRKTSFVEVSEIDKPNRLAYALSR
jgi:hypothetical protein